MIIRPEAARHPKAEGQTENGAGIAGADHWLGTWYATVQGVESLTFTIVFDVNWLVRETAFHFRHSGLAMSSAIFLHLKRRQQFKGVAGTHDKTAGMQPPGSMLRRQPSSHSCR